MGCIDLNRLKIRVQEGSVTVNCNSTIIPPNSFELLIFASPLTYMFAIIHSYVLFHSSKDKKIGITSKERNKYLRNQVDSLSISSLFIG